MSTPHNIKLEVLKELKKNAESIEAEIPEAVSAVYEGDDDRFAASLHALWWRANQVQQGIDRLIKGE